MNEPWSYASIYNYKSTKPKYEPSSTVSVTYGWIDLVYVSSPKCLKQAEIPPISTFGTYNLLSHSILDTHSVIVITFFFHFITKTSTFLFSTRSTKDNLFWRGTLQPLALITMQKA